MSLGIVVAGLNASEFSSLPNETLAGVTPAALRQLTPDHFRLLSAEKLAAIPVDSMTVLNITQLQKDANNIIDASQVIQLRSSLRQTYLSWSRGRFFKRQSCNFMKRVHKISASQVKKKNYHIY